MNTNILTEHTSSKFYMNVLLESYNNQCGAQARPTGIWDFTFPPGTMEYSQY